MFCLRNGLCSHSRARNASSPPAHGQLMEKQQTDLIDWARFALVRDYADRRMPRLLGFFQEDGERYLASCERAARHRNHVALVGHLEQLRRDCVQIGALGVAQLAEEIENEARDIIDNGLVRFALPPHLPALRSAFEETIQAMEAEIRPVEAPQTSRSPIPPPAPLQSSPA